MAYIHYNVLWKLHILKNSCNNVSKGAGFLLISPIQYNLQYLFPYSDRSDTNRNLFNKLGDDNYLFWLIMYHGKGIRNYTKMNIDN